MYSESTQRFEPLADEAVKAYQPEGPIDPEGKRDWTVFHVGEVITIKGVKMRVHRIEPTSLIMRPVHKQKA